MSDGPLPFRPAVDQRNAAPRVVDLDEEAADRVIDALSAETARDIYRTVSAEPRTPPELAEAVDCSLQTVHYHLQSLEEAELVESGGTGYSERGVEMTVYRAADRPLILTTADEETGSQLRDFLSRILGVLAGLAVVALLAQWLAPPPGTGPTGVNATAPVGDASGYPWPPGILVFAGGVVALLLVVAVWYWRRGR